MGSIFEKNGCSDRLVIQTKFSRGSPDTRSARLQRRKLGNPRKETEEVSVSFDEALSAVRGFPLKISPEPSQPWAAIWDLGWRKAAARLR